MTVFEWRSTVPFPADHVYAWHARPGAFERLSPPWQRTRVIERSGDLEHHGTLVFEYRSGPLRGRWVAAHGDAEPGRRFSDRQLHGPFEAWEHTHSFLPAGPDRCVIEDHVEYRLPLGAAGDVVAGHPFATMLERLFRFRHERTLADLTRHAAHAGEPRLRVGRDGRRAARSAASSPPSSRAAATPWRASAAARRRARATSPGTRAPAGSTRPRSTASTPSCTWPARTSATAGRRRARSASWPAVAQGTTLLANTLAAMAQPPRALLSASAVGYYGADRGDAVLTESSTAGRGLSGRRLPCVGGAARRGERRRRQGRAHALRRRHHGGRRHAREPAAGLSRRRGRPGRQRRPVAELDRARRPDRRRRRPALRPDRRRRREPHKSRAGDQPRVRRDARSRAAPPGRAAVARGGRAGGVRRDGRGHAARRAARRPGAAAEGGHSRCATPSSRRRCDSSSGAWRTDGAAGRRAFGPGRAASLQARRPGRSRLTGPEAPRALAEWRRRRGAATTRSAATSSSRAEAAVSSPEAAGSSPGVSSPAESSSAAVHRRPAPAPTGGPLATR